MWVADRSVCWKICSLLYRFNSSLFAIHTFFYQFSLSSHQNLFTVNLHFQGKCVWPILRLQVLILDSFCVGEKELTCSDWSSAVVMQFFLLHYLADKQQWSHTSALVKELVSWIKWVTEWALIIFWQIKISKLYSFLIRKQLSLKFTLYLKSFLKPHSD